MPDLLDATGLQVKSATEIRADLVTAFQTIYGQDISLDQNSPDGQLVGIMAQVATDIREKLAQIYNSFSPSRAIGRQLDERVAINNIQRAGGTFTTIDITITCDRTLTLQGLDDDFNNINGVGYTVQDDAGNQFILIDTVTITAGTYSLPFRAQIIGAVDTVIGTITNPVTIIVGITGISNDVAPTNIGQDEETDSELRQRRERSVANSSNGYLNGLLGLVESLDGVTDAAIYENTGNATDANGIPAHGIWLIVEGGSNTDIGNAIYARKSVGSNMKGDVTVNINTPSGAVFMAQFDRPQATNLYIQFNIKRTDPNHSFNLDIIKDYIVANLSYGIGQYAETSYQTYEAINAITVQGGGGVPIDMQISSDGTTWVDYLSVATLDRKWVLDSSRINITLV